MKTFKNKSFGIILSVFIEGQKSFQDFFWIGFWIFENLEFIRIINLNIV